MVAQTHEQVASTHAEAAEWLKVNEAAGYIGMAPITIRRYIDSGRLPAYRRGPRILWIKRADLDALLQPK